jgi:cytochrome P450
MDIPGSLPFSKAFDFASGAIGERFQNPFWKLKELFFGGRLRRAVSEVKNFGQMIVFNAVQQRQTRTKSAESQSTKDSDTSRHNLIDSLLDHLDDHQIVADAAMNYLSAGRDTTAQSLTWTLYLLLRNPESVATILAELTERFSTPTPTNALSFSTVQPGSLPYITATFNEALRLYPPVPVELKECTADTTFPDGTWLPKGAVVMWVPWAMGRSRQIWGQDADDFHPERWLGSASDQPMTKSAFEFPVFNGGPRACLGKKMAELLAVYVISALIREYEFEEVLDEKHGSHKMANERKSQNSLTLPMAGGLPVIVKRRQGADCGS